MWMHAARASSRSGRSDTLPARQLLDDQWCVQCGYNLRMLSSAGRCPECGTPVATSLELADAVRRRPLWQRLIAYSFANCLAFYIPGVPLAIIWSGGGLSDDIRQVVVAPTLILHVLLENLCTALPWVADGCSLLLGIVTIAFFTRYCVTRAEHPLRVPFWLFLISSCLVFPVVGFAIAVIRSS